MHTPLTAAAGEGVSEPLGVSLTATGINVAIWSAGAAAVELCLFDDDGETEIARIPLRGRTGPVWHGHVPGVGVGRRYGLRAHGPFDPARGHRFNPAKLMLDPHALAIDRPFRLHPSQFGDDDTDSAPSMPKAVVTDPLALPARPSPPRPRVPWGETVIYELHVRGFTRTHPDIPESIRGTFAGLAHPAAITHLKRLGVTTVEILPASAWIDERHLPPLGLTNAWGYNPVAYLAPDPRLAPGGWAEVGAATDALATAGIETILDVVFNHTGEGDALGPTLSLRGLDNAAYYRLDPADPAAYLNDAGTGNTLALDRGPALRLALDSLRAWAGLGGMAGFRFDLATVLGRAPHDFDPAAPLLAAIDQDPALRGLKMIAEPWDCGPGGYRLGGFPPAWGEWNDQFRDTVRGFWRGDDVSLGALARRLAGSQDLFAARRPSRSVNFVVAHDGFTLADLTAHAEKHNAANGEANRDGTDHNLSWNHGVEGPSDDPAIRAARLADQRALLTLLLAARGTPMLAMGAESGRSQGGNNNAYAQDNALSWMDWAGADAGLIAFTGRLVAARAAHPALRADRFLTGAADEARPLPDVDWRTAAGTPPGAEDWDTPTGGTLVMVLAEPLRPGDGDGPDRVALAVHRGAAPVAIILPEPRDGFAWTVIADSADPARQGEATDDRAILAARSVVLFAETPAPARRPKGIDDAALGRLALAAGVAPEWWDLDGGRHPVGPDTQKAILAALRLDAATQQQARERLRGLAAEHDRPPLPPALVVRAGQPAWLTLARDAGDAPIATWVTVTGAAGVVARLRVGDPAGEAARLAGRDGVTVDGRRIPLPALPPGRYVARREDKPDAVCRLTVAPPACYWPPVLGEDGRAWGLSAQIYSLRRTGDQGIGDFTTLGDLAAAGAARGAAILGINPLHALFPQQRERASPYYPSDRRFLDPIHLDLDRIAPGRPPVEAGAARVAGAAGGGGLIDYPGVWAAKAAALESAFAGFAGSPDFDRFVAEGGERLRRFAVFETIAETRPEAGWTDWPGGLARPDSAETRAFAAAHPDRVRYHQFLQWLCDRQFSEAAARAEGLALGLCRDLAVGAAPDGAEPWAEADLVARGVSIGAPPDPFGPNGQVWGLPPRDPHRLRAEGYESFAGLLAANMRHAGALRIDHVLGLGRKFWVPDGAEGADGAYVAFPLTDLLGVTALESHAARCLVIGEDLGTVPDGFRDQLAEAGLLSYRVLHFERDATGLKPPGAYPRPAWACVATHDLPPLAGWWDGTDIAERRALGLIAADDADEARAARQTEKGDLSRALVTAGLIVDRLDPAAPLDPAASAAIHAFIARSGAVLAIAQVEDLAGETTPVNLPGTDRERPNWRRRVSAPLETLFETPLARAILAALAMGRSGGWR